MIQAISDLMARKDSEEVMEISLFLNEVEQALTGGTITQQEYAELMIDIEALKKIIALKNNLELNQLIHKAVLGLIELAKLVKL